MFFEWLTVVTAGLFAGAAIYISLVEHPARLSCGADIAIRQWIPSYRRATIMQASLAALGFLASLGAWWDHPDARWLVGGITLGSVIPFTLIVILPTNKRLLHPSLDRQSLEALQLLKRWGNLHAVRSFLGFVAFLIFIFSV